MPLSRARIVAGRLHALDVHGDALETELLLDCEDALGEEVAELRVAPAHRLEEGGDALGVAEVELQVDQAAPRRLDREGAEVAARHGVDAQAVADVVQVHDLAEVDDLAKTAEDVDRLVLGAIDLESLVRSVGHPVVLDALHEAGRADLVLDEVALAHGLGGERLYVFEMPGAPVARGKRVHAVQQPHHVDGAAAPVGRDAGVVLATGSHVLDQCLELFGPRQLDRLVAVEDDALELLGAEHGADTAAAQAVPFVVLDAGEAHEVLAGRPDDAGLGLAVSRCRATRRSSA